MGDSGWLNRMGMILLAESLGETQGQRKYSLGLKRLLRLRATNPHWLTYRGSEVWRKFRQEW